MEKFIRVYVRLHDNLRVLKYALCVLCLYSNIAIYFLPSRNKRSYSSQYRYYSLHGNSRLNVQTSTYTLILLPRLRVPYITPNNQFG